jgi:hypothetical protein
MSAGAKIERWSGMTTSHGFLVDVFSDGEQGMFSANIMASRPALVPALAPGERPGTMSFDEPIKLRRDDLDVLRALVKKTISERYGEIRVMSDRPRQHIGADAPCGGASGRSPW